MQPQASACRSLRMNRIKAVLHSWLAWQREPGLPYGTALKARFFEADLAVAKESAKWFKAVYQI